MSISTATTAGSFSGAVFLCRVRRKTFANHLQADPHRGISLGPDSLGGLIVHRDPLRCRSDKNLQVLLVPQVLPNDGTQNIFGPSKMDPHAVMARSQNGPANLWLGGLVGTHRINDDVNRHQATITGLKLCGT